MDLDVNALKQYDTILRRTGESDYAVASVATRELALALELPLRQGIMSGDITNGIFEVIPLAPDAAPEFPLDLLAPGTEKDYIAYTAPAHGRIPEASVEYDYVMVPTFMVANGIDWLKKFSRSARWDVVGRALQVMRDGFVKKMNDDCWHTLLAAAVDRNIMVIDSDANAGQFTKRVVSLTKVITQRNGGGNSTSINRRKLTDFYFSPESDAAIFNWGVDQIDEITRREIYIGDGARRISQVNLHILDELGEGQEYQDYFTNTLSGSLGSDVELGVGMDLSRNDSFVMPVRQAIEVQEDPTLARQLRVGYFATAEYGVGVLDGRNIILASW